MICITTNYVCQPSMPPELHHIVKIKEELTSAVLFRVCWDTWWKWVILYIFVLCIQLQHQTILLLFWTLLLLAFLLLLCHAMCSCADEYSFELQMHQTLYWFYRTLCKPRMPDQHNAQWQQWAFTELLHEPSGLLNKEILHILIESYKIIHVYCQ